MTCGICEREEESYGGLCETCGDAIHRLLWIEKRNHEEDAAALARATAGQPNHRLAEAETP